MTYCKVERLIGKKILSIETGKIAKQADGAALVRYGDTMVLATAVSAPEEKEEAGFFPLTVDYREKTYAAGKFPGLSKILLRWPDYALFESAYRSVFVCIRFYCQ